MSKLARLNNGLPVITIPLPQTQTVTLFITAGVGSRFEMANRLGISHCLEHMVFKGTKSYPSAKIISQTLDALGAHYNAYTSKDHTAYYVKVASQHGAIAAKILAEMVFAPKLSAKELASEKGVIIEEIKMYEDNPLMHIENIIEESVFARHDLGRLIIGSRQTVSNISAGDLATWRVSHYRPDNMALIVAGQIDENLQKVIAQNFGQYRAAPKPRRIKKFFVQQKTARTNIVDRSTEQAQLSLGWAGLAQASSDASVVNVLAVLLGGTMSSRLFTQVREKRGLAYYIRAHHDSYVDTGIFTIQAGVDPKKIPAALTVISQELAKIKKTPPSSSELRRAQEHIKGSLLISLEDSSHMAQWYGSQYIVAGKVANPTDRLNKIMAVKATDISRLAKKIFVQNKTNLALIGPTASSSALLAKLKF